MRIAIDYDGTITRDPSLLIAFIKSAIASGHDVVCVTMRSADESIEGLPCKIVYTDCAKKGFFMEKAGLRVDIWVDDHPEMIF